MTESSAALTNQAPDAAKTAIQLKRLLWVTPLALLLALIVNAILRQLVQILFDIPPSFTPITGPSFIGLTTAGVIGAAVVFAIVARLARRPFRTFRIIAIVVLVISWIPDVLLITAPPMPGFETSVPGALTLMLQHAATALIVIVTFERFTVARA